MTTHYPAELQARDLVELAAAVAAQCAAMVRDPRQLSTSGLYQYWATSRCRLDRWSRFLKNSAAEAASRRARDRAPRGAETRAWLEEIFLSEALTRVWSAAALLHDRLQASDSAETIVRGVLSAHVEVRSRAMALLADCRQIDAPHAAAVDRLRRAIERWIDLLVAHVHCQARRLDLAAPLDLCVLAVEPERAGDFADDIARQERGTSRQAWALMMASLKTALDRADLLPSPSADLHHTLAASIVSCFSPQWFDSTGVFHSLWIARLASQAADAQGMLDQLLSAESV